MAKKNFKLSPNSKSKKSKNKPKNLSKKRKNKINFPEYPMHNYTTCANIEQTYSKKIDLILDLDNTCVFCFKKEVTPHIKPDQNFPWIYFEYFNDSHNKLQYFATLRPKLKEFFDRTKPFCNFHIYSMGRVKYVSELQNIIETYCKIKFTKVLGRINDIDFVKQFNRTELSIYNTLIIDDNVDVWEGQNVRQNILESKFFYDERIGVLDINSGKEFENLSSESKQMDYFAEYIKYFAKVKNQLNLNVRETLCILNKTYHKK